MALWELDEIDFEDQYDKADPIDDADLDASMTSCRLWHGSRGVILKNRKNLNKLLVLRPYTYNLVKMQILGNFK